MGLGRLPKELQCLVLEYLANELLNVRLVCKDWLSITRNPFELLVEEKGTFLGLRAGSYKDITVEHLEQLLVLFPSPRSITFLSTLPTHDKPFDILSKVPSLVRLNLQLSTSRASRDHVSQLSVLSSLHELRFGARSIERGENPLHLPIGPGLHQLHRLVLDVRGRLELSLIADLSPDHMPQLSELFVLSGAALSETSLGKLDQFKKLRTLWFGEKYKGISKVDDSHLETIGRCTALTQLVLLNIATVSSEGLRNLTALSSLRALHLRNAGPKLSDLRALGHMQEVRQLLLEEMPSMEENALLSLGSLRHLEFLRLAAFGSSPSYLTSYIRQIPPQRLRCLEIISPNDSLSSVSLFPLLKPFGSLVTLRVCGVKSTLSQLRQLPVHIRELYGVEICG